MKKNWFYGAALLLVTVAPLLLCSCGEKSGGEAHGAPAAQEAEGPPKGPHGGRLLTDGDLRVEFTIFEHGIPPEFRVYFSEGKKPIDPADVKLSAQVHRLGGRMDTIAFHKEGDFLRGEPTVYEPHSFEVKATVEWKGKTTKVGYSQSEARTEITPEAFKAAGISIEESGPVKMKSALDLPGEVVLNPDRMAHVVPRLTGVVTEIPKNLGDKVAKGEVIAAIDSQALAAAKLEYVHAARKLEFAQVTFEREEQLWKKKISPEEDYLSKRHVLEESKDNLRGAEQQLRALALQPAEIKKLQEHTEENLARYELRAPLDGVILEKDVALGEAVKDDADLFTIADLSTVIAKVTVFGKDLKAVRVGQEVTVKSDVLGAEAAGKVAYVGPLLGTGTRTAKAHVVIPNPEGLWRPGLFVGVRIVHEEFTVPVAVRAEALQKFRDWDVVFLKDGNLYEAVSLELGRQDGEWVEIVKGLPAGKKYVAKNSYLIKADILKSGASHDH